MTPVTLLTHDATLDTLSAADYADIWAELRQNHSLRNVIAEMGSTLSPARWQQWEKGEGSLTRQMRNDLRRVVGLSMLPPTVADACAAASPDAAVWQVGEGTPEIIVMVGASPVTLHVNGSVTVADAQTPDVRPLTRPRIARRRYVRPCIPFEYAERLQRLGLDLTWADVVEAGLRAYEVIA